MLVTLHITKQVCLMCNSILKSHISIVVYIVIFCKVMHVLYIASGTESFTSPMHAGTKHQKPFLHIDYMTLVCS